MDNLNLISNFAEFKELKNIDKSTMIGVLEDVFRHALQNGIRHLRAAGRHAVIAHLRFRHGGGRLLHRQGAGGVAPQAVRGVQRRVVLHHGGARCAGAFRLLKAQNALAPGVIHAVHLLHIHRRALPLVPLHQRLFHVRGIAFLRVGKRLYSCLLYTSPSPRDS